MRRIHSVFLCFFAIQLLAPACKIKREKYATEIQAAEIARLESISYKLSANAEGESKDFELTETASYPGSSPLGTVNYAQFLAAEKHKSVVLDILPNGKMIDASTGTIWDESCIAVALFDKLSGAAVRSFYFISNLKKEWSPVDELGPELVVFEYCEEEASLGFNFKKMDNAGLFREALNARGLELTERASLGMFRAGKLGADIAPPRVPGPSEGPAALFEGSSGSAKGLGEGASYAWEPAAEVPLYSQPVRSELSGSARGLGEGAGPASPRVPRSPSPEGAAAEPRVRSEIGDDGVKPPGAGVRGGAGAASDLRAKDATGVETFKDFDTLSLDVRVRRNQFERELFEQLKASKDRYIEGPEFARGSSAKMKEVTIDGNKYALREEILTTKEEIEEAENTRMMFLVQNEFAIHYPHAGFVRTYLAFVDAPSRRFFSIVEIRSGGDARKAFLSRDVVQETKRQLVNNLLVQLQSYQKGYPVTIRGKQYQLKFFHGDIKPANVVLDQEGTRAAFIDFGFSRVILESDAGEIMEMKALTDPVTKQVRQQIISLKFDNPRGTSGYWSPEILAEAEKPGGYTGIEAAQAFMDADRHSMNLSH
ncbi:MAG: serine/threonine protein kinase [Deltaproteobacteria bacterium]|nr:serine/threonine protein kinase [Deltaproteobacteria bacterium]